MLGIGSFWHRSLFMRVTVVHIAAVLILFVVSLFSLSRDPVLVPLRVNLVSLAPAPPAPAAPAQPAGPTTPQPPPTPPAQPAPAPQPVPRPKQAREAAPPPTPDPPPKPKKKRRLRTAEEIRRSAKLTKRPSRPTPPTPPTVKVDAREIAARISKRVSNLKVAVVPTTGRESADPSPPASGQQAASYFAEVTAFLHRLWQQPDRGAIGRADPTVTVSLTVASDGRLARRRVVRPSGIGAMDRSVASVLRQLARLPAPSSHGIRRKSLTIEVVFELD